MITTGIDKRVKVQQIIENQIPEFLLSESPKAVDFLKQYYISQEYQGGVIDLTDNLDQYIKLDNLTPEVVVGETTLTSGITTTSTIVNVDTVSLANPPQGDFYGYIQEGMILKGGTSGAEAKITKKILKRVKKSTRN